MAAANQSVRCGAATRVAMRAAARPLNANNRRFRTNVAAAATLKALIFDCDGVILESEELHRLAYNASFQNFDVRCPGQSGVVDWTEEFYEMLQNKVGGGKPKMRWYFGENGWPTTSILGGRAPSNEAEEAKVIDELQDWKTTKYKDMIGSGEVDPRPGVLRLMDEARAAGIKVAVCSAATKSSVVFTLPALLGEKRFTELDCFLAGDDVPKLKPDPTIYLTAATKMGVLPSECVVIEDSIVGLKAAVGAGMRCIITYTPTTKAQTFAGAERVVSSLGFPNNVTIEELAQARIAQDDRVSFTIPT